MNNKFLKTNTHVALFAALSITTILGCATRSAIVTSTGTNIGVDISQNPATNSPQAKLGYQRVETAIVPTNRSAEPAPGNFGGGAADHGDVIMELRYGGIFDTGPSSGIYQRLAVGYTAVQQPGASVMFARNAGGDVDEKAQAALRNLSSVPEPSTEFIEDVKLIRNARTCHRKEVDAVIANVGAVSYDNIVDGKVTVDQLTAIKEDIEELAPCSPQDNR